MGISHPFGRGARAGQNLLFYLEGLAHHYDAADDSKNPDFQRSAYFSLFQDKLKMLCPTPDPASNRFLCPTTTVNAPGAARHCRRLEFCLQAFPAPGLRVNASESDRG
jgi:hypothetical protein